MGVCCCVSVASSLHLKTSRCTHGRKQCCSKRRYKTFFFTFTFTFYATTSTFHSCSYLPLPALKHGPRLLLLQLGSLTLHRLSASPCLHTSSPQPTFLELQHTISIAYGFASSNVLALLFNLLRMLFPAGCHHSAHPNNSHASWAKAPDSLYRRCPRPAGESPCASVCLLAPLRAL